MSRLKKKTKTLFTDTFQTAETTCFQSPIWELEKIRGGGTNEIVYFVGPAGRKYFFIQGGRPLDNFGNH